MINKRSWYFCVKLQSIGLKRITFVYTAMEQPVTEKLLLHLSRNVVYTTLKEFAVQLLDIPYARFTQIEAKTTEPLDKIFEVWPEYIRYILRIILG